MRALGGMLISYTLPTGLSLWGAFLASLSSVFLFARSEIGFGDVLLTVLMSETMGAAVFYYAGYHLLKEFDLPPDTTMIEFHRFMMGR
jgi:hypothetical protein